MAKKDKTEAAINRWVQEQLEAYPPYTPDLLIDMAWLVTAVKRRARERGASQPNSETPN